MNDPLAEHVDLLRATPHQWGDGKIHIWSYPDGYDRATGQTQCGRRFDVCRGSFAKGPLRNVTCRSCMRSWEADRRRAEWQAQWASEAEDRVRRVIDNDRAWHEWYDNYLASDEWRDRRDRVLTRARGRCEGCGERAARQAHHLTYEHVGNEFLWELVAICRECHERIHGIGR